MENVIETRNLTKRFQQQAAVSGVELRVPRGATYGLLGPNGAGKTTALKVILGLLHPTEGEVRLFGEPWQRRSLARVGALVETPALYENLTGQENLAIHARLLGLPIADLCDLLARVGLDGATGKVVSAYSLGMRQRLGIALALLGRPELLVLDEPTNGLDPVGIREMRDLVRSLRDEGLTVVVSSHLLAEVAQVATHVGVLVGGRLRYEGTLAALLATEQGQLTLETTEQEGALALLSRRYAGVRLDGQRVLVPLAEAEAAGAIAALYQAGIPVLRFNYEHADLETQFMRLVEPQPAVMVRSSATHVGAGSPRPGAVTAPLHGDDRGLADNSASPTKAVANEAVK